MAEYLVTVNDDTFKLTAERCTVEGGVLIFSGEDDKGIYGIIRAIARDEWTEVSRVD